MASKMPSGASSNSFGEIEVSQATAATVYVRLLRWIRKNYRRPILRKPVCQGSQVQKV